MSDALTVSTVLITLALVFYTLGVWAERIKRYLLRWHLVSFWLGLAFDTAGTYAMERLGGGFDWTSPHTITGLIAIVLMAAHAVWATVVVARNDEELRSSFHRFSIVVWLIWLIPYFGGMIAGMLGMEL